MRRVGGTGGKQASQRSRARMVKGMAKEGNRARKPNGQFIAKDSKQQEQEKQNSNGTEKAKGKKGKKLSARARVKAAQEKVLLKVDKILTGNCTSATKGNWNCAKFVLDWSGVSDIRTPLAAPLKRKSAMRMLLGRFKQNSGPAADAKPGK